MTNREMILAGFAVMGLSMITAGAVHDVWANSGNVRSEVAALLFTLKLAYWATAYWLWRVLSRGRRDDDAD